MSISVFLLDDHEIVRRGIAQLLESEDDIKVVGEAGTAAQAMARIPALRPDVSILDVRLPDGEGVSVCRDIRSTVSPPPACLMLTSYLDDEALFGAIIAGAAGYLLKQVTGVDLVGAVRSRRGRWLAAGPRGHRRRAGGGFAWARSRATPGTSRSAHRSDASSGFVADGLTNRQIGTEMFLAEKTVKNYVSSLLHKLGFARRTEAAVWETALHRSGGHSDPG